MSAVIEIVDARSGRTVYVTTRSSAHLRVGWTSSYRAAARFEEDEVEDEVRFWQELLDSPGIEVRAV